MELIGKRVKEKTSPKAEGTIVSYGEKYPNHYKIVWDKEKESLIYAPTHSTEKEILKHCEISN